MDMADANLVGSSSVYFVSLQLLKEALTGESKELEEHKALLQGYIAKFKKEDPFEGIPAETRIHLVRLSEQLPEKGYVLEPLTSQIREAFSIYDKDKRRQRLYAIVGLVLGVASLMFAAYTHYGA